MKSSKRWWMQVVNRGLGRRVCGIMAASVLLLGGVAAFGQRPDVKVTKLKVPLSGRAGFTQLLPGQTGLNFSNFISDRTVMDFRNATVAGLAVGDVDGDGLPDIFFCRTDGTSVLYRNRGNWQFEDITARAGVACAGRKAMGAVLADVNGDGYLDLLVLALGGPNSLFINDGKGRFTEALDFPGRNSKTASVSAAFADIDGNGTLDLYIANHRHHTILDTMTVNALRRVKVGQEPSQEFKDHFVFQSITNRGEAYTNPQELGEADVLYLNDGQGHFRDVTNEKGRWRDEDGKIMAMPQDWGLAVQFRDVNGDGAPDIYVCNDFWTPDRFWINDGTGHFQLAPRLTQRHMSSSCMGVDFADINRDGQVDFFTVDMLSQDHSRRKRQMGTMRPTPLTIGEIENQPQVMQNALFLNRGDGTFAEIAMLAGVKGSEWSWGPMFLDVDLDGYEDLLITNGMIRDYMDTDTTRRLEKIPNPTLEQDKAGRLSYPPLKTSNVIFRNRGDLTFEDVSAAWGFKELAVSGGMAVADFDGDGDLDVVINTTWSAAQVYRNDGVGARVAVRLKGRTPNTQGIGAQLKLLGGPVTQTQEVIAGGRYTSGSDPLRVFAAGQAKGGMTLEVTWRNGRRSVVRDVRANYLYEVDEAGAQPVNAALAVVVKPLFEDVSGLLKHEHHENFFDDFERQPLLPNRLSQLGPGVTWYDVDGDGYDDLIIASGRGWKTALFHNDRQGGFERVNDPVFQVTADQTTVLGWANPQGQRGLLVGSSNFESGSAKAPVVVSYEPVNDALLGAAWKTGGEFPGSASSTGPLAMADVDGDGQLDLFVGGRTIPGRYPEAASSLLFKQRGGKFEKDEENSKVLANLGLVSGAVFGDLNGDGWPDLVVACEWGPVRVFLNERGKLREATKEMGLTGYTGWWNGVALGDLDGDGKLDIVASNWGLNSKYAHAYTLLYPLQIRYGDFDDDGVLDIVETHFDKKMGTWVTERGLSCLSSAMPFIKERTPTYVKFGAASLEEIYGERLKKARTLEANTLEHLVFLNRGGQFQAVPLPVEAQLAPGFGIGVADFDGDGNEDVFLAQNFFPVQIETPRNDGGRAIILKGDGTGHFRAMPGQESGIKVYGDQRGSALGDYDQDGRVDIVVTQNGAATKLYHNTGGKPGLRVRLNGGAGNPQGVGAVARVEYEDGKLGPARVVTAGSGYWSQDSAVQVFGLSGTPKSLWVRWPGGKETRTPIPAQAREITVSLTGEIKVLR